MRAVEPLAEPAGGADGRRRATLAQIDAIRIDQRRRVDDVAGERDGELLGRLPMAAPRPHDIARQAKIGGAVEEPRELAPDRAGKAEGIEDVEPRTGIAEAGEGNAARARPLQCR